MKARKAPPLSIMPPTGAAKKASNERNSIQYLKTQTAILPDPIQKPTHASKVLTKTHTAFTKPSTDQEDTSVRKTVRHMRTGSDGGKPSKVGLRTKPNDRSVDQKAFKHLKTGDQFPQSPTQLSTPSRQIDPSSDKNGEKESSLQPQKFTIEPSVTLTKVRSKIISSLYQGTNTSKQSFELKATIESSKS